MKVFKIIASITLIVLLGLVWVLQNYYQKPFNSTQQFELELAQGASPKKIAFLLENEGIIESAFIFYWLGRATGAWNEIKSGDYIVSGQMSSQKIFEVLKSGISTGRPLLIKEGDNLYQVAQSLENKKLASAKDFIRLCKDPNFIRSLQLEKDPIVSLEGYLYPETYQIPKKTKLEDIVKIFIKEFQAHWKTEFDERAQEIGMNRHQIITLASIVEKETGAKEERPMIASVFFNRLKKGMRLQSDPTTIYGIWEKYSGNIHKSDLLNPTPYNTYTTAALPVGPIANPGVDAIRAVLYPDQSPYLFFVSHNDGTHEFTKSYEDHLNAVKKFQLDSSAREGKSWRDLKK